jgi:hypothetical protein
LGDELLDAVEQNQITNDIALVVLPTNVPGGTSFFLAGRIKVDHTEEFLWAQAPEAWLATFEQPIERRRYGLATQHWPVLCRFNGTESDLTEWPRWARPGVVESLPQEYGDIGGDLPVMGVELAEQGCFQILGVHPTKIPSVRQYYGIDPSTEPKGVLCWIAPRHIAYRRAWGIGSVDQVVGKESSGGQPIEVQMAGADTVANSRGGDVIIGINSEGQLIGKRSGVYRCVFNGIADSSDSSPVGGEGVLSVRFDKVGGSASTGNYGWLPGSTEEAEGHTHDIDIEGAPKLWDRRRSCLTFTQEAFVVATPDSPWIASPLLTASKTESINRVRYFVEYLGPRQR